MNRWLKLALTILAVLLVIFGAVLYLSYDAARDMVTNVPPELSVQTPADFGMPYKEVSTTSADGLNLVGWFIPAQNGSTIIVQHGLESTRESMLDNAEILHRHGYGVLLSTVRAHDGSDGEMIYFGQMEMQDLDAWYRYLLTRDDVEPEHIGILGESYGGFISAQYAAQNENIQAVVDHSGFYSIERTVEVYSKKQGVPMPKLMVPLVLFWGERIAGIDSDRADSTLWVADISPRPILIIHGGQDDYVGGECGHELYETALEPKEFWYDEAGGHANFEELYPEEYERRVTAFYDEWLLDR